MLREPVSLPREHVCRGTAGQLFVERGRGGAFSVDEEDARGRGQPDLVAGVGEKLRDPLPSSREELRTVIDLTSRIVRYAAMGRDGTAHAAAARDAV